MKTVKCSCGETVYLDDDIFDKICHRSICCNRLVCFALGGQVQVSHFVIGKITGKMVDHIDRNIHNNQRINLRHVSVTENNWNASKRKDNKSGYKGVYWCKQHRKYRAAIMVNKTRKHLGLFTDVKQAAMAYNAAAKHYFGDHAVLNSI